LWRRLLLSRGVQVAIDGVLAAGALCAAFLLRFDGWPPDFYVRQALLFLPWICAARLLTNFLAHAYRRVWRYTGIADALHICRTGAAPTCILLLLRLAPLRGAGAVLRLPGSVILLDYMVFVVAAIAVRALRRLAGERRERLRWGGTPQSKSVLLVGAGQAGVMAAKEFASRPDLGMRVVGFLDDDLLKRGAVIQGVEVRGGLADLPAVAAKLPVDEVIVTIASVPARTIRAVVSDCERMRVPVRIIPGLFEILGGQVSTSNLHPVEIEDLLGRPSFDVSHWLDACRPFYRDQRVLVTGGAGSIGRELCRQLMLLHPNAVFMLDKDENTVFEAMRELQHKPAADCSRLRPVVADLRQEGRLRHLVRDLSPTLVFHAAAHKHVHLMEQNPCEAILNNVGGTAALLACVPGSSIRRCILVSTDKAVNPTSIMGASKRAAELMFQAAAQRTPGYCCVRFGNVLGSRGSVVPIFRQQIARGGPVTVTHPETTRYFMTIPEAAHLIVQAAILGGRGEVFLLEMGRPVRIADLARDMIRLSGLRDGEEGDVAIEFTGLRPGEKLHEELLTAGEGVVKTAVDKIFMSSPAFYPLHFVPDRISDLLAAAEANDPRHVIEAFEALDIGFQTSVHAASA